eukprot:SM000030S11316  [mRNA]  locus=s30:152588:154325:+ [translate_table: standard]
MATESLPATLPGKRTRVEAAGGQSGASDEGGVGDRGDEGELSSQFRVYAGQLDAINERRERLVKASRDVTIHSKKVIFAIHRMSAGTRAAVLESAAAELGTVRVRHAARIAAELRAEDYWRLRSAFSPGASTLIPSHSRCVFDLPSGCLPRSWCTIADACTTQMQEYIEAATLLEYCREGRLLTPAELDTGLAELADADGCPFRSSLADYLLGVADLTGELMRLAIGSVAGAGSGGAAGNKAAASCSFVRAVHSGFSQLPKAGELARELPRKLDVMLQSLGKIENASYAVHVRGREYPADMLAAQLLGGGGDDGDMLEML